MLYLFSHGLGDAVQMTTVLAHLRELRPEVNVTIALKSGQESVLAPFCDVVPLADYQGSNGPNVKTMTFYDGPHCYRDAPSTKAEWCLQEVFGVEPVAALCRYFVRYGDAERQRARRWLSQHADLRGERFSVVAIHYERVSCQRRKNLDHRLVGRLVEDIRLRGLVPIILDWDRPHRSPLIQRMKVVSPGHDRELWGGLDLADGATLAALIDQCCYFVGIDSGPLHVAGATSTPSLGVWISHHPVRYFGLSENVTHLVPENHRDLISHRVRHRERGVAYFEHAYRHRTYRAIHELPAVLEAELSAC